MDKLTVPINVRSNHVYRGLMSLFATLKLERPTIYFAQKWANSFKYKMGKEKKWRKLDSDFRIEVEESDK